MFASLHLPESGRLGRVHRFGSGFTGLVLLVFGILGFTDLLGWFGTMGNSVAGLSTNGLLSLISVVFGLVLVAGAFVRGNLASTISTLVGAAFLLSGLANMCVLRTSFNYLNFRMSNVIFSFVVGLMLLIFGLYGRVGGGLTADNPYYRVRHGRDPETDEVVDADRAARHPAASGGAAPALRAGDAGADPRQHTGPSDTRETL